MSGPATGGAAADLGALDGPVLVFGGDLDPPHGNARARAALAAEADRLGVPPARRLAAARPARFRLGARRFATLRPEPPLWATSPWRAKAALLEALAVDAVVAAGSGLPFTQILGGRLWFDPGSAAVPADDGTPRVWFGLLTPVAGGLRVEQRALDYDHAAAADDARAAGRPDDARVLETGLWGDRGALPEAERAAAGHRLGPRRVFWPDMVAR